MYFFLGERKRSDLNLDGGQEFIHSCVTVYFSPDESSIVVLDLKREGKGLKPPVTLSSSQRNK